jgi:multidrug efflux system outer membrane protein
LLTQRPDIRAAERQLRANQANIAAARAAFFPRISLTAGIGLASPSLSNLFENDSRTWIFSPALSLPIFDFGRNRANLDLAKVRANIAVANYEKTIQTAFREVADALDARATLADEIAAQEAVRNSQAARLELAQTRYKSGVANYLEVLDSERDLYSAEQQLLATRLLRLTNAVDLYRSLGGGLNEAGKP